MDRVKLVRSRTLLTFVALAAVVAGACSREGGAGKSAA